MNLTKFEKAVYVGIPWALGMILIICGIISKGAASMRVLAMCTGFICMSLWCLCSLVAKVVQAREK